MSERMNRREFLGTMAAGAALGPGALGMIGADGTAGAPAGSATKGAGRVVLEPFDYRGVRLGDGRWARQWRMARDYYFDVSNDDILYGYRRAAGLAAPGHPLGGWCSRDSSTVFGQWLQAMARASHATDDDRYAGHDHEQEEASQTDNFRPFYSFVEMERYRMYTHPELRSDLW